jgi:hypothetical protein
MDEVDKFLSDLDTVKIMLEVEWEKANEIQNEKERIEHKRKILHLKNELRNSVIKATNLIKTRTETKSTTGIAV